MSSSENFCPVFPAVNQPKSPVLFLINLIRGFLRAALSGWGRLSPPGALGSAAHTKQPEKLREIGPKELDLGFAHPREMFVQGIYAFVHVECAAVSHVLLCQNLGY